MSLSHQTVQTHLSLSTHVPSSPRGGMEVAVYSSDIFLSLWQWIWFRGCCLSSSTESLDLSHNTLNQKQKYLGKKEIQAPSKNIHRIIEQPRLERSLKRSSGAAFHGKGILNEIIQHPVQPHLENLQRWGLYHVPGEVVPVSDCSHCKKRSFLYQDETSLSATHTHCLLPSPRGSL